MFAYAPAVPVTPRPQRTRLLRCALLLLVFALTWLGPSRALAGTLVIEQGREQEVLQLFQPYQLTQDVTPGWKLWNVFIRAREIQVEIRGPGDPPQPCDIRLRHVSETDERTFDKSKNFAFYFPTAPSGACKQAALELVAAVKANDRSTFWRTEVDVVELDPSWTDRWEFVLYEPLFRLAAFVALVVGMLTRELLRLPPRWRWGLVAVLAFGTILRLTMTPPEAALDAWPFSRAPKIAADLWRGAYVGQLSEHAPVFLTDLIFKTGLVFGLLGPAVVFIHAWRMLGSYRAAVFAGGMLAVWPSHLRFSHADGTFISSIVFSGMSFALAHDALRHPNRNWRWCALGLLVPVGLETFTLRPLNQIFAALLVVAALALGQNIPRWRRFLVAGVISVATVAISVPEFFKQHGERLHEVGPHLFVNALKSFFSYRLNTLIRVDMTPPLGVVLAVVGAVTLFRTQRRVGAFLCGWLVLFFITHSLVTPASPLMQARYHLHLIVPLVLLASAGLDSLVSRSRRLGAAAGGMLLLSPFVHSRFIRDVDLNQPAEHAFVMSLRKSIPEGCTVLEYVGGRPTDSRITRLGSARYKSGDLDFYRVVKVNKGAPDVAALIDEARQHSCAVTYLGLECLVDGDPAPACKALREASSAVIAEHTGRNRLYDENNTFANRRRQTMTLGLYDLKGPGTRGAPASD